MKPDSPTPRTDEEKIAAYGCAYCCAVGACPKCFGRAAINKLKRELAEARSGVPSIVRMALMTVLNHVEPGWENSKAIVEAWSNGQLTGLPHGAAWNLAYKLLPLMDKLDALIGFKK